MYAFVKEANTYISLVLMVLNNKSSKCSSRLFVRGSITVCEQSEKDNCDVLLSGAKDVQDFPTPNVGHIKSQTNPVRSVTQMCICV